MSTKYKPFHLNKDYCFDFEGNCLFKGKPHEPINGGYTIEVDGAPVYFDKLRAGLIANFELDFGLEDLRNVEFRKCDSNLLKMKCGYTMWIKENVLVKEMGFSQHFKVIPGYPGFLINKWGDVLSRESGKILSPNINPHGYRVVNIYNPDKEQWRSVGIHILLARTYVLNPLPEKYFVVNHIDGNKLNNNIQNLEWTTYLDNINHAIKEGYRSDNIPCIVRNVLTGEVTEHPSSQKAFDSMGVGRGPLFRNVEGKMIPVLFNKMYEMKPKGDDREWYYGNKPSSSEHTVFESKNIETGEVREFSSMAEMSSELGIRYMRVNGAVNSLEPVAIDGFLVRRKSNEPWPVLYRISKPSNLFSRKQFIGTNKETGETRVFYSGRALMREIELKVNRKTFEIKINKDGFYEQDGWIYRVDIQEPVRLSSNG